jgi:hypothetical protein
MTKRSFTITTAQQGTTTFNGEVLGQAGSYDPRHTHTGDFLPDTQSVPGSKKLSCSACRWFEVTLYDDHDADEYVVHTVGRSILPGEIDYARVSRTSSAYEVVEILTVRQKGSTFIAAPSLRALAQAAAVDDDMRDAYVNRAVV